MARAPWAVGAMLALVVPTAAARAQDAAECAVVECARSIPADTSPVGRRLWELASAAHAIKIEFVDAARTLAVLQGAPLAYDTAAMARTLAAMRASLDRWDDALRQLEAAAAPHLRRAETHVVLGAAYLDRHRTSDAARALTEASRIDADRAEIHASLALAHTLEGRAAEAIRELRLAATLDPGNTVVAYDLAHALRMAGRPDDARAALQKVARMRLAVPLAETGAAQPAQPFNRAGLFRHTSGVAPLFASQAPLAAAFVALESGMYARAFEEFERALASLAAPAGDQVVAGLELWVAGDHNAAVRELRQALAQDPESGRTQRALAFVLRAAGRPSEAEQQLRPRDAGVGDGIDWYRLGQLLEGQSRLADAARAFEQAAARPPMLGRDALYQRLARVRVNQADFAGAAAAYASRITINPNNAEAHRALGEIYFLQGHDDEALAEFLVAVWLDPMDGRAFAALGKVLARAQRYGEAVPALRRAVALDPARADAHYALGQALARTGRADDARRALAEFERLDAAERAKGQRDFRVEQSRADASRLLASGATAEAIAILSALAHEDPANARWTRELGAAYLRANRVEAAIAALAAAQATAPTVDAERLLAEACAAAGRTAEARQHRTRYDEAIRRIRLEQLVTGDL